MRSRKLLLLVAVFSSLWFSEALSSFIVQAQEREEEPPSGALGPAPVNASFDAQVEEFVFGAVDSKGEPTGEPPGWAVQRGLVLKDREARAEPSTGEEFARLVGESPAIVSSAFTIDANAKHLKFSYRLFGDEVERDDEAESLAEATPSETAEPTVEPTATEEPAPIPTEEPVETEAVEEDATPAGDNTLNEDDGPTPELEASQTEEAESEPGAPATEEPQPEPIAEEPVEAVSSDEEKTERKPETGLQVYLLSGDRFTLETLVFEDRCACGQEWRDAWIDVSAYAGQNVQLRFVRTGDSEFTVGIDDVATNLAEAKIGRHRSAAFAGDPVDTTTGNFTETYVDIPPIPGKGVPLGFARTYNSDTTYSGALGPKWTHTYDIGVISESDGSKTVRYADGSTANFIRETPPITWAGLFFHDTTPGSHLYALRSDGVIYRCISGNNCNDLTFGGTAPLPLPPPSPVNFLPPAGSYDKLIQNADGTYTLTTRDQITYAFDSSGKLINIKDRNSNTTTLTYSGNNLTSVKDPSNRTLTFTYSGSRIASVTDPLGRAVTYNTSGNLISVSHVLGGSTTYTYSSTGNRLLTETDPNGNLVFENTYSTAGRVYKQKQIHNGSPAYTCFKYGAGVTNDSDCPAVSPGPSSGQTIVVDPLGNKTKYSHDTSFRTTQIVDALGGVSSFSYDSNSNLTCVTDQLNRKTAFAYDSNGNLTGVIDPLNTTATCTLKSGGKKTTTAYNAKNDPTVITDKLGRKVEYTYNGAGNLTQINHKDASNNVKLRTCFTVDSTGLVTAETQSTTLTDCSGNTTLYEYDGYGNVIAMTQPQFVNGDGPAPTVVSVTPSVFGSDTTAHNVAMPASVSAGDLLLVLFAKDGSGVITTPSGWTELWSEPRGSLVRFGGYAKVADGSEGGATVDFVTSTDEEAVAQVYQIGGWYGSLTGVAHAGAVGSSASPNPPNLASPWGAKDTLWLAAYGADDDDDVSVYPANFTDGTYTESGSTTTSASLGSARRALNAASEDPGAFTIAASEEWVARSIAIRPSPALHATMTYDIGGRLLTSTNELGQTTTYTYNALNQPLTVTDNLSHTTVYTYDLVGNRTTVTDPLSNTTTFNYDNRNRLTSVVDAMSGTTSYTYDANDNRLSVTNARGKTSTYTYDALNRLLTSTDPLSRTASLTYDAASRITEREDARDLVTKYFYDAADRLTSVEYWDGTLVGGVEYDYDEVGNRTEMDDATGVTTYVYDALNRVTSVTFPGSKTVAYTYDNVGNRSRITYPDSKYVDYEYDESNRLVVVTDWLSNETTYAYNPAGQLTTTTYPDGTGLTSVRTYDGAGRLETLVNAQDATVYSSFEYTLDARGFRTGVETLDEVHAFEYDDLGRLTEATFTPEGQSPEVHTYSYDAVGNRTSWNGSTYAYDDADQLTSGASVSYGYDANGNQVSRGADAFEWDHENRLTEATISSTAWSHEYNGDGIRMSRSDGTTTVDYTWDVVGGLPMLLQDGTHTYVYGLGLIAIYDGSEMTYRLVDGLGSTVNLCNQNGELIGEYTYDAYGNERSQSGAETEFAFAGEQSDPNGLDYLRARYYDPEIGRFLGRDPAGEGANFYSYALNNPVNAVDPSGLWTICRSWDSYASDAAAGVYVCALTQEMDAVYVNQLVHDAATDRWVVPFRVEKWEDDDWACYNGGCVGGNKHLLAIGASPQNPGDYQALLTCDNIWLPIVGYRDSPVIAMGCGAIYLDGSDRIRDVVNVSAQVVASVNAAKKCAEWSAGFTAPYDKTPGMQLSRRAAIAGAIACGVGTFIGLPIPLEE